MRSLIQDLRYAARELKRAPTFAGVAIVTLSLSIGANSALFSAINTVLLRALPYKDAQDLYVIASTYRGARREFTSFSNFVDWRTRSRAFAHMAAIRGSDVSITTPSGPEFLTGAAVSEDFFALFSVQPFLGRTFSASEHRPSQDRVVILSHGLWLRRFGGNLAVTGTSVVLNGEPRTVIGVLPPDFAFPDGVELWRPLTLTASDANRRVASVRVIARLRHDIKPAHAQAELVSLARQLASDHPSTNSNWNAELVPLQAKSTEAVRRTLLALWSAVACILLIACANIGIMLLSRGMRRGPELAIRAALGAGQRRVVRQLLTESVLLGLLGGLGGIVVAAWGVFILRATASAEIPRLAAVHLDVPVLVFTAGLSIGTGVLVGIVPVLRIMRSDLHSALRGGGTLASPSLRRHGFMRVLAVGQVIMSFVLLIAAGLMIRTVDGLQKVNLGFNPNRLLTFYVSLPDVTYTRDAEVRTFFNTFLDRIRVIPGVRSASAMNALYIHWSDAFVIPVVIEGRPIPDQSRPADVHIRIVDTQIHSVLQIPIVSGRSFTPLDGPDAPGVAVINEAMAKLHFAGENPIGHRISVLSSGPGREIWQQIVGVVGNVRQRGLDVEVFPEIHIPYTQSPVSQMAILVRAADEPVALVPSIRAELKVLDPNLPLKYMQTMDGIISKSLANRLFGMRLFSAFASVALILTAVGLYGVVATTVSNRAREMAVRLALGASPRRVVWMIVREMSVVLLAGVTAGAVVAFGASRSLEPLLFGVLRGDLVTYLSTPVILVIVSLLSCYVPARRLVRIDPSTILKSE